MNCSVSITVWFSEDFLGHPGRVAGALEETGYWSRWSGRFEPFGARVRFRGDSALASGVALRSISDLYEALLPGDGMSLVLASARVAGYVERGWLRVLTEVGDGRDDLAFGEFLVDAAGIGSREVQCFAGPVSQVFTAHTRTSGERKVLAR